MTESSDEEYAADGADDVPGPRPEDAALADAVSELGDADLDLLQNLQLSGAHLACSHLLQNQMDFFSAEEQQYGTYCGLHAPGKQKQRRAEHKFHKKPARSKGNRGLAIDSGGYDGAAVSYGKRGGLVRVGVPVK